MAVISKVSCPFVGDPKFVKKISVDSSGQFKCTLPNPVYAAFGKSYVVGNSLAAAEKEYNVIVDKFHTSATTTRKIIAWDFNGDWDHSFRKGITLNLAAQVFIETTITAGDSKLVTYETDRPNDLPGELSNGAHDIVGYSRTPTGIMEWTPEREAFFCRLANSMLAVVKVIQQLKDPAKAIAFADGKSQFLLDQTTKAKV